MPRPVYVRVRDKETGHHVSINKTRFDANPDLWQLLKQPATDSAGHPLPMKPKTTVSTEAVKKSTTQSGQSAASNKENS